MTEWTDERAIEAYERLVREWVSATHRARWIVVDAGRALLTLKAERDAALDRAKVLERECRAWREANDIGCESCAWEYGTVSDEKEKRWRANEVRLAAARAATGELTEGETK